MISSSQSQSQTQSPAPTRPQPNRVPPNIFLRIRGRTSPTNNKHPIRTRLPNNTPITLLLKILILERRSGRKTNRDEPQMVRLRVLARAERHAGACRPVV